MTTRLMQRLAALGLLFTLAVLLAGGCGDDDDDEGTAGDTSPTATEGDTTRLGPGAAGIPSDPRAVRGLEGLLDLDDGLAIWKERPANEDRTGVTDDKILLGRWAGASNPGIAPYESVWGPTIDALVKRINEAGGINGRKLEIITRDDQYNPSVTVQVVRELVENDKVLGLFFGIGNAPHQAVGEYTISKGVPNLWVFDGNVKWVEPETVPTEFPGLFPDIVEGQETATAIMKEHPGGKVAAIFQDDALGHPFMEGFTPTIENAGGSVVAEIPYDVMAQDMSSYVQQAVDANPDALAFYGAFTAAISVIRSLRENFGSDSPIYQRGALPNPQVNQILDGVAFTRNTKDAYLNPDDPLWPALEALATEEGAPYNETLTLLVFREFEHLVRALEMAGPDLTREGLIEAIETGFDGSWTCKTCLAPTILGPNDHWSFEAVMTVRWDNAKQGYDQITELTNYETSEGNGIRGNIPGYDCKPGTCSWAE